MNPWPFINGAYGVSVLFLAVAGGLSFARYRRARRRLAAAEKA
ncbi:MAG TPA: hypothetical protein VEQ16_00940 [Acidocella sp.]|jgi:hypothetical protein|nr:hypothetical protein [Acidocella sp.]